MLLCSAAACWATFHSCQGATRILSHVDKSRSAAVRRRLPRQKCGGTPSWPSARRPGPGRSLQLRHGRLQVSTAGRFSLPAWHLHCRCRRSHVWPCRCGLFRSNRAGPWTAEAACGAAVVAAQHGAVQSYIRRTHSAARGSARCSAWRCVWPGVGAGGRQCAKPRRSPRSRLRSLARLQVIFMTCTCIYT